MSGALVLVRPVPPVTLHEDLIAEWAADLQLRGCMVNTVKAYVYDLRRFRRFLGRPIETATLTDLRAYGRSLLARQATIGTWARRATALRTFFEWYRRREGQVVSIAHDLDVPRRPKSVHRWWTDAQVRQFRRAFHNGQPARLLTSHSRPDNMPPGPFKADPRIVVRRDRAIMELGLVGLRVAEVVALDVGDLINLCSDRAAIVIHRKGGKDQVLPLPPDARTALRQWLRVRPDVPTPVLFIRLPVHLAKPRLHYTSIARLVGTYALRVGLSLPPRKAFHHLRHTAGQQLAEQGFGIEEAQAWLGHASPATTQIYYEVSSRRLQRVARRFRY